MVMIGHFAKRFLAVFECDKHHPLPFLILCILSIFIIFKDREQEHYSVWPPRTDNEPMQVLIKELSLKPGKQFKGRGVVLLDMYHDAPSSWNEFGNILGSKFRQEFGNDLFIDVMANEIPLINEYGHWTSPPMLALQCTAFGRANDLISRSAHSLREFRPNLARLCGVSIVICDQKIQTGKLLYQGSAQGHPLFIHRIDSVNFGQFTPTITKIANDAKEILDYLQSEDFDGKKIAIVERPINYDLVPAENISIILNTGPKIQVDAYSPGISLLVIPFDFSYCLKAEGKGLIQILPVNLSQIGLLVEGKATIEIKYNYSILDHASCRGKDLQRINKLKLESAATGRLFHDYKK